jgi:hypothetical protein
MMDAIEKSKWHLDKNGLPWREMSPSMKAKTLKRIKEILPALRKCFPGMTDEEIIEEETKMRVL